MLIARHAALALLLLILLPAQAQYSYDPNKPKVNEDSLQTDSLEADTTSSGELKDLQLSEGDKTSELKTQALTWVRRLIYRGFLDDETTGTSATYALTEWSETSGPFGPVLAHVTVIYLGSVTWLGKPSAWFQATFKSFEDDRPSVDFDLVLSANGGLGEAYRSLWRLNKEELANCYFGPPTGQLDYDREDHPRAGEEQTLKLFSGEFLVTKYVGSGADGAKVVAYRGAGVPPLEIVRLGYGNYSLNLRDRASDVEPKFEVPLPTSR